MNIEQQAATIRTRQPRTLDQIRTLLKHPRSLARPLADWRPPKRRLSPTATVAISHMRVGPDVCHAVQACGELREPAYVVTAHFSGLSPRQAEAWVRAILPPHSAASAHEMVGLAPTFCWLIDAKFRPLSSPAELFEYAPAA